MGLEATAHRRAMAQARVPADGFNSALQAIIARMPNATSSQLANLRAAQRVIAERCDEITRAMPMSAIMSLEEIPEARMAWRGFNGLSGEFISALAWGPHSPSRDHFDELTDEVATLLLARAPFTTHGTIRCVCSRFQRLLDLPAFHKQRVTSKYAEHGLITVGGGCVGRQEIFAAGGWLLLGGRWRQIAPTIHPRNCHGAIMFNGELVVMGGYLQNDDDDPNDPEGHPEEESLRSVEAYNVRTNSWRLLPPMSRARDDPVTAIIGDLLVVVGSPKGMTTEDVSAGIDEWDWDEAPVSAEAYSSATNSWKALPSMPHPGENFACALNDRLYVLAGRKLQMFDFDTNTWTILADMPVPNMYDNEHWWFSVSSAVVHERKIMVMGGMAVPTDRWSGVSERALDMVIVYDPEADAWTNSPHSLPSPRVFCYTTKLDGEIVLITPASHDRRDEEWYGPPFRYRSGVWETFEIPPMSERVVDDHGCDVPSITGLLIG